MPWLKGFSPHADSVFFLFPHRQIMDKDRKNVYNVYNGL